MKRIIIAFTTIVLFSCNNEQEPVEPEVVSTCNAPEVPALYGELHDMPLRVTVFATWPERIISLAPTTETLNGLTYSEPYLDLHRIRMNFSACNIPEGYLKHDQIIKITAKAYVETDFMEFAKYIYKEKPDEKYGTSRLIFLDDVKITPVE